MESVDKPYRPPRFETLAATQAKEPRLRALFQELAERAEKLDALREELNAAIIHHREARTGKEFRFTKPQRQTLQDFERDAKEGLATLAERIVRLDDLHLIKLALRSEQQALELEERLYGSFRKEDRESAENVLAFRRETLNLIRGYIETSESKDQIV